MTHKDSTYIISATKFISGRLGSPGHKTVSYFLTMHVPRLGQLIIMRRGTLYRLVSNPGEGVVILSKMNLISYHFLIVGVALQHDSSERMRKRSAWKAVRSFSAEQLEGTVSARN